MIARYQVLAQRIRLELQELERTTAAVRRHWDRATTAPADQDAFLNSVALNLHSLYSGLERIFELIATEIDGGPLGGEAWHAELLKQMALDLPDARPPVLQEGTAAALDEYRRFRHRVRNIYAAHLDPDRVAPLVQGLSALWEQVKRDLTSFAEFLEWLSRSDQSPPESAGKAQ